jgi:hypothetical protein
MMLVIQKGSPPRVVTKGVVVTYEFENNTHSTGKTNFWQHAGKLFGGRIQPDTGIKGKGLRGGMEAAVGKLENSWLRRRLFSDIRR